MKRPRCSDLVHTRLRRLSLSMLVCVASACAGDSPAASRIALARDIHVAAVLRNAGTSTAASFDHVRIVFRRVGGAAALDTIVGFLPGASSATLKLSVPLSPNAPATGELVTLTLSCISTAGDTVYRGGPAVVLLSAFIAAPPMTVVLWPTGPGLPLDSLPAVVDSAIAVPFAISVLSGDGQTGLVGALLGAPLRALVTNRFGKPVPGATVTWTVALGGGVLDAPTSVTDSGGVATNRLRLGLLPGLNEVSAVTAGLAADIFKLTSVVQ